jgi:hypothetical protein
MPQIGKSRSGINYNTGLSNTSGPPMLGGNSKQSFDTKISHGPSDTREQFKGLPNTGFTPGANENVGGGLLLQQRLRLRFVQLIGDGMSHKDAAKQVQKETGFHARTGQKIVAKVEHTKEKKIKYAGKYLTRKPYKGVTGRSGHRRPRKQSPYGTPAGLK